MKTLDYIRDIKIYQNLDGYRVSVDAVLLYDFVNLKRIGNFVDIGTGSGVIGMLLAKKYEASKGLLVEIQSSLADVARQNIAMNNLQDRLRLIEADIKDIAHSDDYIGRFDVVVSNPPFRRTKTGIISPKDERAMARHETNLTLAQLLKSTSLLLRHHGHFFMIYLPERLPEVVLKMKENSLEIKRLRFVHSYINSEAKMLLVEAVKGAKPGGMKVLNPLIIYSERGLYSDELLNIYKT